MFSPSTQLQRRPLPAGASPGGPYPDCPSLLRPGPSQAPPSSCPSLNRPRPCRAHFLPASGSAGSALCRPLPPQTPPSTGSSLDNPALCKLLPPRAPPPQASPRLTPLPPQAPPSIGPALRSPAFRSFSARLSSVQPPPAGLEQFSSGKVPAAVSTLMSGGQAGFSFGPRVCFSLQTPEVMGRR